MKIDNIEFRHADSQICEVVMEWFEGRALKHVLDGDRSIKIANPHKPGFEIKIKGAGFSGTGIRFDTRHKSGLKAPVFDYDGRMMEDVAAGHDNACLGGASFQQSVNEYKITRRLEELGIPVVPCPGYGKITSMGKTSWFSIFEMETDWRNIVIPKVEMDEFVDANIEVSSKILDLAISHQLIGYCWCVGAPGGQRYLKDLHPFRLADPVNMSQVSWVMQVLFDLHILCLSALFFPNLHELKNVPENLQALPFRCVLADAGKQEHEALRWSIIAKYMLKPPENFDAETLIALLYANPISAALMDLCPAEYARY